MPRKQLPRTVFVLLVIVTNFLVILAFSGNVYFSNQLAGSLTATGLGFFLAKLLTGNKERTWLELAWFPLLNICTTLFGAGMRGALGPQPALGSVEWSQTAFAFGVSIVVFMIQRRSGTVAEKIPRPANEQRPEA